MQPVRSRVGLHYEPEDAGDFYLTSSYLRPGADGAKEEYFVRFGSHSSGEQ
jgi:hypothetical protein